MSEDAEFVHVREAAARLGYTEAQTRRIFKRLAWRGLIPRPARGLDLWPRRVVETAERLLREEPAAG